MSNYLTKIGTKVLDLFECWDEEEKGGNFVWNYSDWRRARQWSGFHIWSSQASNSSKLSESTVQPSYYIIAALFNTFQSEGSNLGPKDRV